MTTVLVLLVVLAVLMVAALGWFLLRQRHRYDAANRLLPDVPTHAPAEWAGAHTPEAKLHRRLRDALKSLSQVVAVDDGSLLQLRVDIQQEALALDDRLIATAALPDRLRTQPLTQIEQAVTAIEDAIGTYATAATQTRDTALESSVTAVKSQMSILAQIRSAIPPPG